MKTEIKLSSLVSMFCLGAFSIASAADLEKTATLPAVPTSFPTNAPTSTGNTAFYAPTLKPVEIGNGWYLRGDVGYTAKMNNGTSSFNTFSIANGYRAGTVTSHSTDDEVSVGMGIGYKFSDLIRADATLDILRGKFTANGTGLESCTGPANTTCSYTASGAYTNQMLMANAYIDLATISGFTPYIGLGAGLTKVRYGSVTSYGACEDGTGTCGVIEDAIFLHEGKSEWRNTMALMAGVSYDLNDQVKIDLGYKYSNIASGNTYNYDDDSMIAGATGVQARDKGFARHEIRAGMRLSLW